MGIFGGIIGRGIGRGRKKGSLNAPSVSDIAHAKKSRPWSGTLGGRKRKQLYIKIYARSVGHLGTTKEMCQATKSTLACPSDPYADMACPL